MSDNTKQVWVIVEKKGLVYHEVKKYKRKNYALKYLAKLRKENKAEIIKLKS